MTPLYLDCRTCGTATIGRTSWTKRSPEARAALRDEGILPRRLGDQCVPCYARELARKQDGARSTVRIPRDVLLSEWGALKNPALSRRANCQQVAPRLGMRWRSMERALKRAGVAA